MMMMRSCEIPLGFRFYPTKEELISSYLVPWVTGTPLPWNGVVHKALYGGAPWDVFSDDGDDYWQPNITEGGDTNKNSSHVYVFTTLLRNPTKIQRTAGGGTWGGQTGPKDILDSQSGETIGYSRMFSFQHPHSCGASSEYGHWIMHEYVLSKRMLKMIPNAAAKDMVLCKITRTFKNSGGRHQPPQPQFIPPAIADSRMQFFPPATPDDSQMQFFPPATPDSQMQFFPPAIDNYYMQFFPPAIVEEDGDKSRNKKQKLMDDEEGGQNSLEGVSIPEVEKVDYSCLESVSENSLEALSIPELEKEDGSIFSWINSVVDFEEPILQSLESYENNEVPSDSDNDFSDLFGIRRENR